VKFLRDIILHNFFIKVIALVLALCTWSYIGGQLYRESISKESETASLIEVSGENIVAKSLPIYVKIEGEPASGYRVALNRISVNPSHSVVAGPPDIIEDISYITTEPVTVQGKNNTVKVNVKIAPLQGCKIGYDGFVNVTIPISRMKR
jgi:YbbR domain-containing protein